MYINEHAPLTASFAVPYACALAILPAAGVLGAALAFREGMLAAVAFSVAVLLGGVRALLFRQVAYPLSSVVYVGIALVVVAIASAVRASASTMQWWGVGFEVGTVGSLILFAGAIVAGVLVPPGSTVWIWRTWIAACVVTLIYALIAWWVSGGTVLPYGPGELSFLSASGIVCATMLLLRAQRPIERAVYMIACLLLGSALVIFFDRVAIILALAVSLFGTALLYRRTGLLLAPLAVLAIIAPVTLMFAFGTIEPLFSFPPEVRPTLRATELVTIPVLFNDRASALVGTGPRTFANAWEARRPIELNETSLWYVTPEEGSSTVVTFLVSFGALGLAALLVLGATVLWLGATRDRDVALLSREEVSKETAIVIFIFLFGTLAVHTSASSLFLFTGLTAGLAASSSDSTAVLRVPFIVRIAFVFVAVGISSVLIYISALQLRAANHHAAGVQLGAADDRAGAAARFERATNLWRVSRYEQDAAAAFLRATLQAIDTGSNEAAATYASQAATFADRAVETDAKDWAAQFLRGSVYLALLERGIVYNISGARVALEQAMMLAPARPEPYYLTAVLESALGNENAARAALLRALSWKKDYAPAMLMMKERGW
ncbi:hypothetical protein HY418_03720 [Candidatus Kaiserbacteria bacterium]|nr:hypothetical protein [Candidatus Kaiserbacteria bacterium]